MGRMFEFITKTINPLGGECVWDAGADYGGRCRYCWASHVKDRFGIRKYTGEPFLFHGGLRQIESLGEDDFAFAVTMRDLYNPNVPADYRWAIYDSIARSKGKVLLLTKNPEGAFTDLGAMRSTAGLIPNLVIGATIESDIDHQGISGAPRITDRLRWMYAIRTEFPEQKTFVSVEPILKFTQDFPRRLVQLRPEAVAVGYDNYDNGLPEPTMKETEGLIDALEDAECMLVYRKTIRAAWDEFDGVEVPI